MTLQTALNPLVNAGIIEPVASKVYGLGIGSQANVIAVMSTLIVLFTRPDMMPPFFRRGVPKVALVSAAAGLLPFMLSLTAIMALVAAVVVIAFRKTARLTARATFAVSALITAVFGFFAFEIGSAFGFAANLSNRESYLYDCTTS
jgi:hypothetical protein